jgi:hypothetical protein
MSASTTTATALSNEEENIPIELTLAQSSQTGDNRSREESQGPLTPRTLVKAKELMRRVTEKVKKEEAAAREAAAREAAAASENVQQPQIVPPEVKKAPLKRKLVTSSSGASARAFEASSSSSSSATSASIKQLTKEIDDGSKKLTAEELNNPLNKEYNKLLLKKEILERASIHESDYAKHLYPTLNDPEFNTKIALRKEFYDAKMNVDNEEDVEAKAELLCNAPFELAPNQQFVRNFLSVETPYNSLLLYHGLGTGKTCSAISVAEEMRDYMKQMGITQQIIVIASPNVQDNFRNQLFDERELKEIEPGVWNIRACTGNKFIKEINPMNMKGMTRENIIKQIKKLIQSYYLFFGYNEFANYVRNNAASVGISADDVAIQQIKKAKKGEPLKAVDAKRGRKSAAAIAKNAEVEAASIENLSVVKLRKLFSNTLIIIDEVHNIRITDDNRDKRVAKILFQIVQKVNNVRLLLLSGTPMYNSYKEIVWLINLMNLNDKRATIDITDVFDEKGNFRVDQSGREIGSELLIRKATGYLSFVRGENPYTFPYRVFPKEHSPEYSLLYQTQVQQPPISYPRTQMNGRHIDQPIEHIDVYMTQVGDIQEAGYRYIINDMKATYIFKKTAAIRRKAIAAAAASAGEAEDTDVVEGEKGKDKGTGTGKGKGTSKGTSKGKGNAKDNGAKAAQQISDDMVIENENFPSFENMDTIGYAVVQRPLEALNIVYPHTSLIEHMSDPDQEVDIASCIGKEGLRQVMSYEIENAVMRQNFEYKPEFIRNFKNPKIEGAGAGAVASGSAAKSSNAHRIFAPNNIGRYSAKIKNICDKVMSSDGIILAYSQYIDGGVVPIALALEELGFTRYCSRGANSSLFKIKPAPSIDSTSFLPQKQHIAKFPDRPFQAARYSVITGDPTISPDNMFELKALTDEDNTNGEKVKVVIISVAGAEGLDFKNIRQVHILEPWYNMNLLEQIIGRAIRNCSHKRLPYSQRNVELYLYGTYLTNKEIEAIDLYLYRLSEFKAVKIGIVSRALRESAVDCLLNIQHNTQTAEHLNRNVVQKLSSRKNIDYQIGARPFSALCDYMQRCDYVCRPTFSNGKPIQEQKELYGFSEEESGDEESGSGGRTGDVRIDTFNEKFMSMNIDKIIQKIRDLFKESFFYKKTGRSGLIAHINATRPYPLAQINLALTQIVSDPNEYVHDKYGRLGHVVNVGDYYMFQPVEISDEHASIYDRSVPIPYKHESVVFPLSKDISEDYLKIQGLSKPALKQAIQKQILESSNPDPNPDPNPNPNIAVAENVEQMVADLAPVEKKAVKLSTEQSSATASASASAAVSMPVKASKSEQESIELISQMEATLEICKTVYTKHTQDEWYYYCGKVIEQISKNEEFGITRDKLYELVVANLLEHLHINDSKMLINYLYHKNNNSMVIRRNLGSALASSVGISVQPLTQFEQMILTYYSKQILHKPLGGKRKLAAAEASRGDEAVAEDMAIILFHEKKTVFELLVLRYESPEWSFAEPEDERDFSVILSTAQTQYIRSMNMIIGFITYFKREYLIFKVKMMQKKRDKGARCDQAGKADTIAMINNILANNPKTSGDEFRLTIETTKDRTQKELCVFQEFLLRSFNENRVNGKKWFFTPGESLLCDIEKMHID